ncbi:MAG: hypothetical protein II956_04610 [Bacteroidales bacterium]|nr:hypothetical protein [Bacteroidales bacterium]
MATAVTFNYNSEVGLYWNLLKGLSSSVKTELVNLLQGSLKTDKPDNADKQHQKDYYEILDKFLTYSKYGEKWDGENAVPLTEKVKNNFSELLNKIDKKLLSGMTIFPEINGTLLIDSTIKEAGICLGNDTFSYYITENDVISGQDNIPFTVKKLIDTIKKING